MVEPTIGGAQTLGLKAVEDRVRKIEPLPARVRQLEEPRLLLDRGTAGNQMTRGSRRRYRQPAEVRASLVFLEAEVVQRRAAAKSVEEGNGKLTAVTLMPPLSELLPRLPHYGALYTRPTPSFSNCIW